MHNFWKLNQTVGFIKSQKNLKLVEIQFDLSKSLFGFQVKCAAAAAEFGHEWSMVH